uniref:Uncharacterized protein n=1 Tax=Vitis vinifera TaxID=29760 RepID=A5B263_VITVI|nr:hypothetical protein VITISV_002282 [Vitis vinifera]
MLRSGSCVPKGGFVAAKHPSKWGRGCEIPAGAFRDRLQTAITSSFQIQIMYRLKHWTFEFPSFETRYRSDRNVSNGGVAATCQLMVCSLKDFKLRNTLRNGSSAAKWWISKHGKFTAISQLRNGCTWLRNGTRVPRDLFAAAKIFAENDGRL